MKREFLQGIRIGEEALPKEVIDAIMAENGKVTAKSDGNVTITALAVFVGIFPGPFCGCLHIYTKTPISQFQNQNLTP